MGIKLNPTLMKPPIVICGRFTVISKMQKFTYFGNSIVIPVLLVHHVEGLMANLVIAHLLEFEWRRLKHGSFSADWLPPIPKYIPVHRIRHV